jgi:hypothetical protein
MAPEAAEALKRHYRIGSGETLAGGVDRGIMQFATDARFYVPNVSLARRLPSDAKLTVYHFHEVRILWPYGQAHICDP